LKLNLQVYLCQFFPDDWHQLQIQESWNGIYAGGCPNFVQWVNNKQYQLKVDTKTDVFIVLSQADIRKFGTKNEYNTIGVYLMKDAVPGKRVLKVKGKRVVQSTGYANTRDRVIEVSLEPSPLPYAIVPTTFNPSIEAGYKISVYSKFPVQLSHVVPGSAEDWKMQKIDGTWNSANAGGCGNHESWLANPKFTITTPQDTLLSIRLIAAFRGASDAIGLYVFGDGLLLPQDEIVCSTKTFIKGSEVTTLKVRLKGSLQPYTVMPCTFEPKIIGQFALVVYSENPVTLAAIK
jgi:hypothetical protein